MSRLRRVSKLDSSTPSFEIEETNATPHGAVTSLLLEYPGHDLSQDRLDARDRLDDRMSGRRCGTEWTKDVRHH